MTGGVAQVMRLGVQTPILPKKKIKRKEERGTVEERKGLLVPQNRKPNISVTIKQIYDDLTLESLAYL
jgi:hypothetical protein